MRREMAVSIALLKQAWPVKVNVENDGKNKSVETYHVLKDDVGLCNLPETPKRMQ